MNLENLRTLFHEQLKDVCSAEKQLTEAIPKMADAATTPELKQALNDHHRQTEQHLERAEKLLSQMNLTVGGKTCVAMEGLIKEGDEMIKEAHKDALDAGLIAAAQKVEHYEIASYGTARTWAQMVGDVRAARMLQETLEEESQANEKLTRIAESQANVEAR
jgi:ferritin-like metal-binding protein YciE